MKKISVIIPVYNVEPYIRKCLDSIIHQTYDNLEIICINDGSADASGKICEEYASRDSRIKVIHQHNRGYPAALNVGLEQVTGTYVGFADPDDWVEPDFFEAAVQMMEQYEVDFVCTGFYKDSLGQSIPVKSKLKFEPNIANRKQILLYTLMRDTYPAFGFYCWNKLFRAERFSKEAVEKPLRFNEDIKVGPDVVMFTEYALSSERGYYTETPYYHYFQREDSLFHSKDLASRKNVLTAYDKIIELLENNEMGSDVCIWAKRFYVYHASLLAEIAIEKNDRGNLEDMQKAMKRYLDEYVSTNQKYPDRINRIYQLLNAKL